MENFDKLKIDYFGNSINWKFQNFQKLKIYFGNFRLIEHFTIFKRLFGKLIALGGGVARLVKKKGKKEKKKTFPHSWKNIVLIGSGTTQL